MGFIKQKQEEQESKRKQEEDDRRIFEQTALSNSAEYSKCKILIPILRNLLDEVAKECRYIIEVNPTKFASEFGQNYQAGYRLYIAEKAGWFSLKKGLHAFSISVGSASVSYDGSIKCNAIYVFIPAKSSPFDASSGTDYDIKYLPEGHEQIKEWLKNILFATYHKARKV